MSIDKQKLEERLWDLQRYEPVGTINDQFGGASMEQDSTGEWVKLEDVLKEIRKA